VRERYGPPVAAGNRFTVARGAAGPGMLLGRAVTGVFGWVTIGERPPSPDELPCAWASAP